MRSCLVGALLQRLLLSPEKLAERNAFVRDYAAIGMFVGWLMLVLTSSGKYALAFTPAEVEFLFPAPLPRRQIIAYKLARGVPNTALMAVLFTFAAPASGSWPVTAIGLFLTIEFFQLSAVAVALVRQTASAHAYTWTRRAALVAGVSILAWAAGFALLKDAAGGWREAVDSFRNSWIGALLLAPFQPFCRLCAAQELNLATGGYAAAAAVIDAVLVALIMLLDAAYLETAAAVSEKLYRRVQQLQRGVWSSNVRPDRSRSLAHAAATGRRRSDCVATIAAPVAIFDGLALLAAGRSALALAVLIVRDTEDVRLGLALLLGQLTILESLVAAFLPLGLRADVDRLDALKSLPLSPAALVVGEIVPAAMVLSLGQCLLLAGMTAMSDKLFVAAVSAACFALPLNLLLLGLSDLLFLIFPYRPAAGALNVQSHQLAIYMLYALIAAALATLAVAGGLLIDSLIPAPGAFAVGAWCIVLLESLFALAAASLALHWLDVSAETPPD